VIDEGEQKTNQRFLHMPWRAIMKLLDALRKLLDSL
jgi:hypothetical protein